MTGNNGENTILQQLETLLAMTQSGNLSVMKQAEEQLAMFSNQPAFGPKLLELMMRCQDENVKISGSIYFKNYVKKYYGAEEDIIAENDQTFIKDSIVKVMLLSPNLVQKQLSTSITIIAEHDFPGKWNSLLPLLVQKIENERDFSKISSVLSIIESISEHVSKQAQSEKVDQEILYILQLFQNVWLQSLNRWSQTICNLVSSSSSSSSPKTEVNNNNNNNENIKHQIRSLQQLITIFFNLNSITLLAFFDENMNIWTKPFHNLLLINDNNNNNNNNNNNILSALHSSEDTPSPIDLLRTSIIRALKLFNTRYEEEYSKYVPTFVKIVCELLATINDNERYDGLAAESIAYLSSVARQAWNTPLFKDNNTLNNIVQQILMRNIRLRESDLNMYEMNGEEWVRRDMDGSDLYTRRRGAIELVQGLCEHFEKDISMIITALVQELIQTYSKNPSKNFIAKDTAINLMLAVSIKGSTKLLGATRVNQNVPVMKFFTEQVYPELINSSKNDCTVGGGGGGRNPGVPHPIITSDCLKFTIAYRNLWPMENFLQLLPMACGFLAKEDYVLHTYAAIAVDKLLAMRVKKNGCSNNTNNNNNNNSAEENSNPNVAQTSSSAAAAELMVYKYPKNELLNILSNVLISLFKVLTNFEESYTNEYVMKCIMRVVSRAQEGLLNVIQPVIEQIKQILIRTSKNPQKPIFCHYMFEVIAACIIYVCKGRRTEPKKNKTSSSSSPSKQQMISKEMSIKRVAQFEKELIPVFFGILKMEHCLEFHPYVFQIMGQMLRIHGSVDESYAQLFDSLLSNQLWNHDGNILAISSMFGDYLRMVNISQFVSERRLTGMLGIFQHLLSKRTQDQHAFAILKSIFQYIPLQRLSKYISQTIELICIRLRAKKSTLLCCNFVVCLAIFIIKHGLSALLAACDAVQKDIFCMILEKVWLPFVRNVENLIDRKQLVIGMILMCADPAFTNHSILVNMYPAVISSVVVVFEANPLDIIDHKNTEYYLSKLEAEGYGSKFSGLSFTAPPVHDSTANYDDPRKMLVQSMMKCMGNNEQHCVQLSMMMKPVIVKQINNYAQKFHLKFQLPVQQQQQQQQQ